MQNYETYGEGRFKSPETLHRIKVQLTDICNTYGNHEVVRLKVHNQINDL
jgi:hypothetical protein